MGAIDVAAMFLFALRRRLRAKDIVSGRWSEMGVTYWRRIDPKTTQDLRSCFKCERNNNNEAQGLKGFDVIRDGQSLWIVCRGCKSKERLKT